MIFELNDLAETQSWRPYDPATGFSGFQSSIDAKVAPEQRWPRQTTAKFLRTPSMEGVVDVQQGYLWTMSRAHSQHQKLVLSPHDVWYIVLAELAAIIASNVDTCRPIFTRSPDKIMIIVPSDDPTTIDLNLIEAELRRLIPVDLDTFLPSFSTITPQARYACLAAFCDAASQYYSYGTFACGIRAIDINGTLVDWVKLQEHASSIAAMFHGVGLSAVNEWMSRLCKAIDNIVIALDKNSPDTLQTIFSATRIGSGSQFQIDGWFADIYSKPGMRGRQLEGFPASWSYVPYVSMATGRKFTGVHGCLMTKKNSNGFYYGDYGEIITEVVPVETAK